MVRVSNKFNATHVWHATQGIRCNFLTTCEYYVRIISTLMTHVSDGTIPFTPLSETLDTRLNYFTCLNITLDRCPFTAHKLHGLE